MLHAVLQVDTLAIAWLIVSALEAAGFHPAPVSESDHVWLAGADQVYKVYVADSERAAVVEFLIEQGYGKHVVHAWCVRRSDSHKAPASK